MPVNPYRRLDEEQKRRVLDEAGRRRFRCGVCGSEEFEVGEAMELGHIWFNEEIGTYMVALRCTRRGCGNRTGLRLAGSDFLGEV
ncbi:hypothetical protein [Rubrobacter calidifluminis]|uniref:hypothetical protein n=1 Tax=Rubrobacter calidifluminis TaxID=1392640 RepID=UPI00235EB774|nr:hypothetical protein [Rubrobacter calidifluminis]